MNARKRNKFGGTETNQKIIIYSERDAISHENSIIRAKLMFF
jgi:hypothetical protein